MKLLSVTEDRYPPFRADVVELFPKQMPARGHTINWLMQRGPEAKTDSSSLEEAWVHVQRAEICFSPFYPIPVLLSTSPTKLIEYMVMAKCIVANEHPVQCAVMADRGVGRCIPWSEEAFAEEVCRQLDDAEAARRAAARGPDWVRAHRTYDVIADRVEERYIALLGQGA